jgi:transcriptional regulator with XRE-family HTH domain
VVLYHVAYYVSRGGDLRRAACYGFATSHMGVNVKDTLPPIRRARELTQEQLGIKARIARTDIVAFENGNTEVGAARLQRLADALEVSVLELGAPADQVDGRGQLLLDRLEELAATVGDLLERQASTEKEIASLRSQLRKRAAPPAGAASESKRPRAKKAAR